MARATDRILGLELGAQDYLVKPFHAREMLLRCEQLLELSRHLAVSPSRQEQQINLGGLTFHPHEGCLHRAGAAAVTLSRGERILLLALCRAPGRVLTREQLALASGSLAPASSSRSIDMRLSRLRRLLEQASGGSVQIETVRAHGYTLRIEAPAREESGEEQTSEEVS
jgi:DNA-binding response OmpR family regulator